MEQIQNLEKDYLLQIADIMREVTANMLQIKQMEMEEKMYNNQLLLSTKEASRLLGGIDSQKVIRMYKDKHCLIDGIEDGKNIKIFYDSIIEYLRKARGMVQDDYFTNTKNLIKKASVSRSEFDRIMGRN